MKVYLKKFGVWEIMINPPNLSNKKDKATSQKDAKKDNTIALKFLMDGLLGNASSTKKVLGNALQQRIFGSNWRMNIKRKDKK